jgi:hypothetical protein
MMDSALQALIGVGGDWNDMPVTPLIPFALGSMRTFATGGEIMHAWVRRAQGSAGGGLATTLDIDMCDDDGNVCVQLRSFSCRAVNDEQRLSPARHAPKAAVAQPGQGVAFDGEFYESLLDQILSKEVSVVDAVKIG